MKTIKIQMRIFLLLLILLLLYSCRNQAQASKRKHSPLSDKEKKYWFNGEAELTSYELEQARYGEMRKGKAVLVFVSEPFSTKSWSKSSDGVSVLKLNYTKKFRTGVYPYSLMISTFLPISEGDHSLMLSMSMQEWCRQSYLALRNQEQFELEVNSYFKGESIEKTLPKAYLEDDFWTILRLRPETLPEGEQKVIPAFFYMTLKHKEMKAYKAELKKQKVDVNTLSYIIHYSELDRTLEIHYEKAFPHKIIYWEESYNDGGRMLRTKGTLIKTLKSAYWNKNSKQDAQLRKELRLEK